MSYFIGRYPLNYAPVANERILIGLKQYGDRVFKSALHPEVDETQFMVNCTATRKPLDHVGHVLYPFHDNGCNLLDKCGISTAVYDAREKFGYDFYNETGYGKLVSARYVDGYGFYEVESHKGVTRVRTTTWVPQPTGLDAVIRKIEVGTLRPTAQTLEVYPQLHLKGEAWERDGVLINKVRNFEGENPDKGGSPPSDFFLAIECVDAGRPFCGSWKRNAAFEANELKVIDTMRERPNVTFRVMRESQPEEWSEPVYVLLGLGTTEEMALANLKALKASPDYAYQSTWNWWDRWHARGLQLEVKNPQLDQVLRVSKTIMRMAFDEFGLTSYIGYYWYQGAVWIRDNCWIAMGLSRIDYTDDAFRILNALRQIVKKRTDGNFHFLYGSRNHAVGDFSWESDSMGLILTAAGYWFDQCHDLDKARHLWDWLAYSADWIANNLDEEVGLVVPDAGIWEEWSDEFGQKREHMVWTSMISAYGVKKAGEIAAALGDAERAARYQATYETIRDSIEQRCIKDGILVRSPESTERNLDSSVLYGWTWTPMFAADHPALPRTLQAMEERIQDRALGGFWRHENSNNDLGDTMPWVSATLWAGECYLHLGDYEKANDCLQWVLNNASQCSQLPECMFCGDVPHVTGMSSLSCMGIWGFMLALEANQEGVPAMEAVVGKA